MLFDLEVVDVGQQTSEENLAENADLDTPVAALPVASRPLPVADIAEAGTGASVSLTALAARVALLLEGRNRPPSGLAHDVAPVAVLPDLEAFLAGSGDVARDFLPTDVVGSEIGASGSCSAGGPSPEDCCDGSCYAGLDLFAGIAEQHICRSLSTVCSLSPCLQGQSCSVLDVFEDRVRACHCVVFAFGAKSMLPPVPRLLRWTVFVDFVG